MFNVRARVDGLPPGWLAKKQRHCCAVAQPASLAAWSRCRPRCYKQAQPRCKHTARRRASTRKHAAPPTRARPPAATHTPSIPLLQSARAQPPATRSPTRQQPPTILLVQRGKLLQEQRPEHGRPLPVGAALRRLQQLAGVRRVSAAAAAAAGGPGAVGPCSRLGTCVAVRPLPDQPSSPVCQPARGLLGPAQQLLVRHSRAMHCYNAAASFWFGSLWLRSCDAALCADFGAALAPHKQQQGPAAPCAYSTTVSIVPLSNKLADKLPPEGHVRVHGLLAQEAVGVDVRGRRGARGAVVQEAVAKHHCTGWGKGGY